MIVQFKDGTLFEYDKVIAEASTVCVVRYENEFYLLNKSQLCDKIEKDE